MEQLSTFYNYEYEQTLKDLMKYRAKMLKEAENDPKLQAAIIKACKADPKFFFDNFLFTVKNDIFFSPEMPYAIPFRLFDYQRDVVDILWDCIINKKDIFSEKSRQMSFTWLVLGLFLYGFIFHGHRYLIISRTGGEVDTGGDVNSCFGRLRFMLQFLPQWLLPKDFDKSEGGNNNKRMNICSSDSPASITGESANPNAARGGTYTAIFMDEMAFMQDAVSINKAAASATPCRMMNSTPFGEGNEYYRMKILAKQGRIIGLTLHWSLHPFYTKEWYEWKTAGMTKEQIEQELEINYNVSIEGRVYKKFAQKPLGDVDIGDYPYNFLYSLYCSIDNSHGGNDPHAIIIAQKDMNGKVRIVDYLESKMNITQMAHFMAKTPICPLTDEEDKFLTRYKEYKTPIFIADPNDTDSQWNDTSIGAEYRKVGVTLNTPNLVSDKKTGKRIIEQIRLGTKMLNRLQVDISNCSQFVSVMQNARYPQRKEGAQSTSEIIDPVHDWTSHGRTAYEYLCMFLEENETQEVKQTNRVPQTRQIADPVTGELRTVTY